MNMTHDERIRRLKGMLQQVAGDGGLEDAGQNLRMVMEAVRDWARAQPEPLERLVEFSERIGPIKQHTGQYRLREVPVRLSRVRILDILLWTEMAIHGPTPHSLWSRLVRRRGRGGLILTEIPVDVLTADMSRDLQVRKW